MALAMAQVTALADGIADVALAGRGGLGRPGVFVELPPRSILEWTPAAVRSARRSASRLTASWSESVAADCSPRSISRRTSARAGEG